MKTFEITYRFRFPDGNKWTYPVKLHETSLEITEKCVSDLPQWTELSCHKCPNCPLPEDTVRHCPLASRLAPIVSEFQNIISYEDIALEVITDERKITQQTTAQRAISSLMGVLIACSGCPHTGFFRPMARFHLPLADKLETLYRSSSMYLLAQYFRYQEDLESRFSLKGLQTIYANIQRINICLVKRIRLASKADSAINAVILLDTYAMAIPFIMDESLEDIKHLFTSYLEIPDLLFSSQLR